MASWLSFRAEEDEVEDEASYYRYDSTWEEDEEDDGEGEEEEEEEEDGVEQEAAGAEDAADEAAPGRARGSQQSQERRLNSSPLSLGVYQFSGRRNWNAARDLQQYRHRYPGLIEPENDEEEEMWNLSFYKNEISFLPHGLHIEDLLESWWDNYKILEENHSYIQWLFPLREYGMNRRAKPLTCQEIQAFKKSKEVMQRFVRAYQLMLRFYGIVLVNEETGELKRAENWAERFQNLNRYSHNNLRITRILKCLGEMGYEHYQVHLVKFFLTETLVKEMLPNVKRSALDYFLFTIRNKRKRRKLVHYAWQHFKPRSSFVWGPHNKLLKYKPRLTKSRPQQKAELKQESPGEKGDGSGENHQDQSPKEEQKAGDAADLQAEVGDEDVKEKLSECVSKEGDGEGEKEASFTQQEEKDLNSETEEVQGAAENDCTKENKKRKLDGNTADTKKTGPLKNPTDIENISHNLGECAIDAEIPSSDPLLQAEEDPEALKEDDADTKDSTGPEAADAAVKRRKVDTRTSKNKKFNLAINLSMGPPASSASLNPSVSDTEEKENVSEENAAVEAASEKGGGDANGGAVRPPAGSRLPKAGCTPAGDSLKSNGDEVTAGSDGDHCNRTLLGGKSEVVVVEKYRKVENTNGKGQAGVTGKQQVPESLEQTMVPTYPEEDSAEVTTQKPESSELAAEPDAEQAAVE